MTFIHAGTALLPQGWCRDVRIGFAAGRIASVEAGLAPAAGDERHAIVLPGMPNLHSHAFQRGMAGLAEMRKRLFSGEYDAHWMILGNVLNCDLLELASMSAKGYLAPPCRSITKLYNFRLIRSWNGDTPERLQLLPTVEV